MDIYFTVYTLIIHFNALRFLAEPLVASKNNDISTAMNKTLKVVGIVTGIFLGAIFLLAVVFIYGSKYIGAKYEIDDPVYDADKTWTFKAEFYDSNFNVLRTDTIILTTYDQRFLIFQNKVTWSLKKGNTETTQTTGIREDQHEIWLHPPRFDGYSEFTEYSAFPAIKKPISVEKEWNTSLMLGTYATQESGSKLIVNYSVESIDTIHANPIVREVKIMGQGTSGLGKRKNLMTFTEKLGFVKLDYSKENGEKLVIQLIGKKNRK